MREPRSDIDGGNHGQPGGKDNNDDIGDRENRLNQSQGPEEQGEVSISLIV